jgi:hypothetical protein
MIIYGVKFLVNGRIALKIGETKRDGDKRISEQFINLKEKNYEIAFEISSETINGDFISDKKIHKELENRGFEKIGTETFIINPEVAISVINSMKYGIDIEITRTQTFSLREEQQNAIEITSAYFLKFEKSNSNKPKFLWNAKMRFGKTFTSYKLCENLKLKRIIILTYKPAVKDAWRSDLNFHIDFRGWKFMDSDTEIDHTLLSSLNYPIVYFASYQDILGKDNSGGLKEKNKWIFSYEWDILIIDEYHFGAWRELPTQLIESDENEFSNNEIENIKLNFKFTLFLSGTPFRALSEGEFLEDQIFNWTYSDEQNKKNEFSNKEINPYASLPKLSIHLHDLPHQIKNLIIDTNQFSLNKLFSADGNEEFAKFKNESAVIQFLKYISGKFIFETTELSKNYLFPYSYNNYNFSVKHSLWFLPSVSACFAMNNLIEKIKLNEFFDFKRLVVAGKTAGIGIYALAPVRDSQRDPLNSKTISFTCGKLLTGVTIPPLGSILMLTDTNSPEAYFQAAFRVQSPFVINNKTIKDIGFVFDFNPNRSLQLIKDYAIKLSDKRKSVKQAVAEIIDNMDLISCQAGEILQLDPRSLLDIAIGGIESTQLARRWESNKLFNLQTDVFESLLKDAKAISIITNIKGFRNFVEDANKIINLTKQKEKNKKTRKSGNGESESQDKQLKEDTKVAKELIEKLKKFINRIPIFMYLTDFREESIKDVILRLDTELFEEVTGISKDDFEYLLDMRLFNEKILNDAVYKFRRFEEASFEYLNLN